MYGMCFAFAQTILRRFRLEMAKSADTGYVTDAATHFPLFHRVAQIEILNGS